MNTHPDEPWVHRFTDVVRGHDQVRGLICGHLHRAVTVAWEGRTIAICSSTAPQVSPDLRPIDENNPDDRPMIVAEAPAYALHHWNGRELVRRSEKRRVGTECVSTVRTRGEPET